MIQVVLYTDADHAANELVRQSLRELHSELPHHLIEIDLNGDPDLQRKYGSKAPVVKVGAYTLASPFSKLDLKVALGAAKDAGERPTKGKTGRSWSLRFNHGLRFFSRHWLAIFNLLVLVYASLPFAAPTLMQLGAPGAAQVLYTAYSPFCHQLAFRSWFLFGEQSAYPRALAGTELTTFEQATGIDEQDFLASRRFVGDERVGYKVALCERDIAIYVGILLAGLAFGLVRSRLNPLPLRYWFLLGILPIALDGGSQLISQIGLLSLPARESTPFLRTLTGGLFGIINVWMAYPNVEISMRETRESLAFKLAVASRQEPPSTPEHPPE